MTEKRICKQCGEEKELCYENFREQNNANKFRPECRKCSNKNNVQYQKDNPPEARQQRKAEKAAIKAQETLTGKRICADCKEAKKLTKDNFTWRKDKQDFRYECKECRAKEGKRYRKNSTEVSKAYYKNNKTKRRENADKWKENNPEHVKTRQNEYSRKKRKNNPAYYMRILITNQVNIMLGKFGSNKHSRSFMEFFPQTIDETSAHIEKLFARPDNLTPDGKVWMNWGNRGEYRSATWDDNDHRTWVWNLDHITPHSKLMYAELEDLNFKKCWALENLRPLSAKQNILDNRFRSDEQIVAIKASIADFIVALNQNIVGPIVDIQAHLTPLD